MDYTNKKTTIAPPLSLENINISYYILITILVIFVLIIIILMKFNPQGFNKAFGKEIFVTIPLLIFIAYLIKELYSYKDNPAATIYSYFPMYQSENFIKFIYGFIALAALTLFFMLLYVGGIFDTPPPENNTAMLTNFLIIFIFIAVSAFIYKKSQQKTESTINMLPKIIQDLNNLRIKYVLMLALFVLFMLLLYFVNPWNVMADYGGPVMFFGLFIGISMTIMILIYQFFINKSSSANISDKDVPGAFSFITKGAYILMAIGISFGLIYAGLKMLGVFDQDASKPESWGHIIFNIILFCSMLGIIYKLANAGGFLDKNPYYRLILNTLLYIPCLLVTLVNYLYLLFGLGKDTLLGKDSLGKDSLGLGKTFSPPTPFEIKMLALSLILLSGYFLWTFLGKKYIQAAYLKQGGKQIINQPIPTNILTNAASYQSLTGDDTFDYQYALSFWFYIDSFSPSTNASYNKVVPILSYGENPIIKYSSADNTLYITVKQNEEVDEDNTNKKDEKINNEKIDFEKMGKWNNVQDNINEAIEYVKSMPFGNDIDADGHRIIYKQPDVKLQKWNHLLLNYNGGTLDVFYNGKLIKSAIEVVPYMKYDTLTVGTENGISGNIANLMYFKKPLGLLGIHTLYASLKDKNPPVISENPDTLVPL